jgi:hypothetical protein
MSKEKQKIISDICPFYKEYGTCEQCNKAIDIDDQPCYFERMANAIIENGYRKQSEWISVDERLPEECKDVLCFAGNKMVLAFMEKTEDCGEYVPVFWDLVAYNRDDTWDEVCATHWMPLPEPPKMKGGAE